MTAPFNPLLVPRYADAVRRLLSEDLDLGSISPEIIIALVLETDRPEWSALKEELLTAAGGSIGAVAAQVSAARIRNPTGSGRVVTLERIDVSVDTAATILMTINDQNATIGGAEALLSTRDALLSGRADTNTRDGVALTSFVNNVAPAGQTIVQVNIQAMDNFQYDKALVLRPGHAVDVGTVTVNTTLRTTFTARERTARVGGELAPK